MDGGEVTARDIMAEEGLGLFAFQLETLNPDLESASLTKLLATVIQETDRLTDSWHQSSKRVSDARECHYRAIEVIDGLTASEEHNYRRLLILGYLFGQQSSEKASDPQESYPLAIEGIKGLTDSEEQNYRRLFTIGYQYGRLTNPGRKAINKGAMARIKVMKAGMKRSEGGRVAGEKRKADTTSRKAEAKKIWDKLIAAGRPEHELASLIAGRMGVTSKTVREWRRSGWGKKTNGS